MWYQVHKVPKDTWLDKGKESWPSWSLVMWIFPIGFGLSTLSLSFSLCLSLAPHLYLHNQQKWDYPKRERVKKKKVGVCVYVRVKLFEPGGFCPKIGSLQAGNYRPRGESGKQHTHYTWRLLAQHRTPEWQCKLVAASFLCGQKSRGSLVFCWARLMFLSCMWESSCLWGGGSG